MSRNIAVDIIPAATALIRSRLAAGIRRVATGFVSVCTGAVSTRTRCRRARTFNSRLAAGILRCWLCGPPSPSAGAPPGPRDTNPRWSLAASGPRKALREVSRGSASSRLSNSGCGFLRVPELSQHRGRPWGALCVVSQNLSDVLHSGSGRFCYL